MPPVRVKTPSNEERDIWLAEASVGVSTTSGLTAVVTFFAAVLLTKTGTGAPEAQTNLRVPLAMLFASALGFLFSTLIYANASGSIARGDPQRFARDVVHGNVVGEYFGVYMLILAILTASYGASADRWLGAMTLALALVGLWFYHSYGHALLRRYVPRKSNQAAFVGSLSILAVVQYLSFDNDPGWLYYSASAGVVVLLSTLAAFAIARGREDHG